MLRADQLDWVDLENTSVEALLKPIVCAVMGIAVPMMAATVRLA